MISYFLNFLAILSTLFMTILMLWIFRKARPVNHLSPLLSLLVCLEILFFFMVLSGSRLNLWLSGFLLLTGGLIGLLRGLLDKLEFQNGVVLGKIPLIFLFGWGISLALAQSLNMFSSILFSSLGLIPLIFMTGTQAGISAGLFLRRFMMPNQTPQVAR